MSYYNETKIPKENNPSVRNGYIQRVPDLITNYIVEMPILIGSGNILKWKNKSDKIGGLTLQYITVMAFRYFMFPGMTFQIESPSVLV